MANKHGLSPRQAKARLQNTKTKSNKKKGLENRTFYKSIAKQSFQEKIDNGDIVQVKNPIGETYYWYRRGRKTCVNTNMKIDPNGFSQYATANSSPMVTNKLLKTLRK